MKTKKIILTNVCNGKTSELKINEALEPIIMRSVKNLLTDAGFEFEIKVKTITQDLN